MNNKGRNKNKDGDRVEQLLQAAQDELLLKLSVDSHMSRVSPDYLLPDLDRRFQALKTRPSSNPNANQSSASTNRQPPPDADDLLARFAALKASSSSTTTAASAVAGFGQDCGGDSDEEEDEVEKIIQWAKDAARLDPSPPSDDDVIDDDNDSTDGEDEDKNRVDKTKCN
ncbi:hypothetical protein P3X46_011374 [Hevea brasiliensis]|uniref:Uncharacterized protein n=1 Tax=Hevea brasiliensis TaxID=3981 RepID=A0ABQ9ML35_HEVBR|nr:uncharacterized protein LOC110666605 [Hevea brasiliensis]KAJ9179604.1 hypothetical protein P3X46_011374 [Hevea brasiliensis]